METGQVQVIVENENEKEVDMKMLIGVDYRYYH